MFFFENWSWTSADFINITWQVLNPQPVGVSLHTNLFPTFSNTKGTSLNSAKRSSVKLLSNPSSPPYLKSWVRSYICAMVKSRYIGDGHPTFNRNPYNWYLKPHYWIDDHPLLYGNNGSLDPSTYEKRSQKCNRFRIFGESMDLHTLNFGCFCDLENSNDMNQVANEGWKTLPQ